MYKAYLKNENEEIQTYHVNVIEKSIDDTIAVYINGSSRDVLDKEFGAGIDFDIADVDSWMADFRHSPFWCMPNFGKNLADVPDETQGFIYQKRNGIFGVILPVTAEKYKCVLCGNKNGGLTAKLFSWYDMTYCNSLAFVRAEGKNPFRLLENCAQTSLKLLNNGCRSRTERCYPQIFEYLGWCSWDAMGINVNEQDLIKKCEEFKQKNIPVRWAMIDDMWGEVHDFYDNTYDTRENMFKLMHSSKLFSFKADPKRFPNGLKNCIEKINEYDIKVGMWHPITGYWMGVDPDGEIYKTLNDCIIKSTDNTKYIPSYKKDKAFIYYDAFHSYLRNCGAEFIKVDNQSAMTKNNYKGLAPMGEIAREYHDALEASAGLHFSGKMINCMGMASEDMWNRSSSPLSRCSDDFQPEDNAWFSKHIMQCSYNDLIQGQLYYCDWDMWWTDDGQAEKNSILRAISGGPIYVSDMLERSRQEILMPLILSDGKILRCDRPAMPTADCLVKNPLNSGSALKLQNICNDSGVIAAFNVDDQGNSVHTTISPADVDGIEGDEFAVYEHFSRTLKILKKHEKFDLALNSISDYRLYIVVQIKNNFAVIGRTDKFISPKTVKSVIGKNVLLHEDGEYAVVENGELKFMQ